MPLKKFNAVTHPNVRANQLDPCINVNGKNGQFIFSKGAMERLEIIEGTLLEFAQDDEDPTKWFLSLVDKDGFELRYKKEALAFANVRVAREIFQSLKLPEKNTGKILLAPKAVKIAGAQYWALDLSLLKKK